MDKIISITRKRLKLKTLILIAFIGFGLSTIITNSIINNDVTLLKAHF